jgi:hypothetical protein
MKKFIITLVFLSLISSVNLLSKGKDPKKEAQKNARRDSLITVLLKTSRINEQFNRMTGSFEKFKKLPELKIEDNIELTRIFKDSFNKDTLYNIILRAYRKNYDENYTIKIINFMNSPLMQKISSFDSHRFDSLSVTELQAMAANLPRSGRTINMVRELCKVTNIVDITTDLTVKFLKSFIEAINPKLPKDKQLTIETYNQFMNKLNASIKPAMQLSMELVMYYRYKDLTYTEFQELINFYSFNYGFWYNQTLTDGMSKAFEYSSQKLIANMQKSNIILKLSNK